MSFGGALRKRQAWVALALGVCALAAAALLAARSATERRAVRRAVPILDGRLEVSGLGAPLEIVRDVRGIAHVRAASERDAWFGLGFVHAQDRLAQMSWLARVARGRTAEAIGPEGLPVDRWSRTLGLGRLADAQAERLDAPTRARLEAYAAGVGAWIERITTGAVPPPVAMARLGVDPEPWRAADSLAVAKALAGGLDGSVPASLALGDLVDRLGAFAARPFFPPEAAGQLVPIPLPRLEARRPGGMRADPAALAHASVGAGGMRADPAALAHALGLAGRSIGSSAWLVGSAAAANGRPLLAADLHHEPTLPALLYEAHLFAPGFEVIGAGPPGVPVFWSGHNGRVAWAATHARAAVVDLHEETLEPDGEGAGRYRNGSRWSPLERREEPIAVRGQEADPWVVRTTHHGPLLEGLLEEGRPPLALAWAGAQPGDGVAALQRAAHARDAAAFRAALADHHEPAFAFVYADVSGGGGRQLAGWLPRRSIPTALVRVPGRSGWYDWRGRLAYDELPHAPLTGTWLLAADQALGGPESIEWWWRPGERSTRIEALLRNAAAQAPVDAATLAALQADVVSPGAGERVQRVLVLAGEVATLPPEARQLAGLLAEWDGVAGADSRGAAAWHALLQALLTRLLEPALGPDLFARTLGLRGLQPELLLDALIAAASAPDPDPDALIDAADLGDAVRDSLRRTGLLLRVELGPNPEKWLWGRLHPLRFRPFGWPAATGLDPARPYGGDGLTIAVGEYDAAAPYEVTVVSAHRLVVDLASPELALSALAPGASEHPGDPRRDAGLERWLAGRPALLATHRFVVDEGAVGRLALVPRAPAP
jgi:penicillin amidase